ncbi:MAG: hypothetical protein LBD99_03545, partial [Candidatus Margulisbacteria bacterium]|nr:hypothetical protein [Candidatus Margulisiibacteriota bacterium]
MHRAICSAIADVFRTYPDINLIRQDDGIYLDNIQKADEAFAGSHVASGLQRQYLDVPGDNAFKSALTEVNEYFESKKIPLPIMYKYILAVNNMTVDFDGKSTPVSVVDFDTNKRRLPVLLGLDKGFDLEVRPEAEAKAAFINGHLLGYPVREDDPEKLKDIDADAALVYTEKMKRPPSEFVLAGGDASRFLLIFKALQDNLKDCSQTYIDDNFLKEMAGNKKYKDIKPVLEKGVNGLKEALDFPAHWFSLSRGNIRELEITNEGILTNDLRILADEVLRENGQLPKAMIYALRIIGHNYDVYVNYLTAKILNMIRQCEENDSYIPGRLYVMVKDDDMRKAQKKSVDAMAEDKIFDSDNMEICFIDRCADGIPVDTNGHFLFDQDGALVLTSAGHGPALGKAVNYARQQRGVNEPKDRDGAVLALSFH